VRIGLLHAAGSAENKQQGPFNLSLLAMLAAAAGDEAVARRAISVHRANRARQPDQLMDLNRLFIVYAYLDLGDLDGAWAEMKKLMDMGLGPTVWDIRQNLLMQHYFGGYAPFEEFVGSNVR